MIDILRSTGFVYGMMAFNAAWLLLLYFNYGRSRTAKEDFEQRASTNATGYKTKDLLLNVVVAKNETMKQSMYYVLMPVVNMAYIFLLHITN